MIVLDASVLIAQFDRSDVHHQRAQQVLLAAIGQDLGASVYTLAETLVGPARHGELDRAKTVLRTLAVFPLPLDPDGHIQLAILRAETGLKLPDCCVLLAAQSAAGTVATFDERLAHAAAGRGLSVVTA